MSDLNKIGYKGKDMYEGWCLPPNTWKNVIFIDKRNIYGTRYNNTFKFKVRDFIIWR
jgi:hypothetical protein